MLVGLRMSLKYYRIKCPLIRSVTPKNKGEEEYMHRGISSRTFARGFNLSDDVEIGTVTFNNGLLVVELRRIILSTRN